ncbi:MAG TPA: TRAP transporter small permease [Alphaproteobacteria bacterium]|nr:TRAP transporter small permease [Alphaproteobacteria bacterium]
MHRIFDAVDGALRIFAALCLVGLFALVTLQVVMRYGFGSVPFFMEEFARYAMIWMALAATAVAVRENSHIRIEFLALILGSAAPIAARLLSAFLDTVSLAVFLSLVWYGVDMVRFAAGQTSEGMQIPLSIPYAALPVAFTAAAMFSALRLLFTEKPR